MLLSPVTLLLLVLAIPGLGFTLFLMLLLILQPRFARAMFDVTATAMRPSSPVTSDITMPPASSPLMLPGDVASAKRTRSDGVE